MRRNGIDPDPTVATMRDRHGTCPVTTHLGLRATLVAGYEDARQVHADPSFGFAALPGPPGVPEEVEQARRAGALLALDPPAHTRLRRMVAARFTTRAVRELQPRVATIVDEALDRMVSGGSPADLVSDFALPVPCLVICELLGVPYEDRGRFQGISARRMVDLAPGERVEVVRASRDYMRSLVDRARRNPGRDLLGTLVTEYGDRTADEGGVDDDELVGLADLLLIAGHETTAGTIALGTLAVLRDPDQHRLLRAIARDPDDEAMSRSVEEVLRHVSVASSGFPRVADHDVVVGGRTIAAGTVVTASLCAANRDPVLGPDLDRLRLDREPVHHLAFGHGIHHCVGAPLARLELRLAFRALFRRLPTLALADPDAVTFRQEGLTHGLTSLPVTW